MEKKQKKKNTSVESAIAFRSIGLIFGIAAVRLKQIGVDVPLPSLMGVKWLRIGVDSSNREVGHSPSNREVEVSQSDRCHDWYGFSGQNEWLLLKWLSKYLHYAGVPQRVAKMTIRLWVEGKS